MDEAPNQEFLLRACSSPVPDEGDFKVLLSLCEEACIQLIAKRVGDNPKLCFLDQILTPKNIERFVTVPS